MGKPKQKLALAALFIAVLLAAPTLYARDTDVPHGSMMPGGMMGERNMMGQMSQMMTHCGSMMQAGPRGNRPNDQWRRDTPAKPDKGS